MITVAVVGGKLQGMEAVYLARKAGFQTVLVDRRAHPPAKGMCDFFLQADVRARSGELTALLKSADFVLPALEDTDALAALQRLALAHTLNVAFDFDAYAITASKIKSDRLFHENGIPAPVYYPGGSAPYIAKPAFGSGSVGVRILPAAEDAAAFLRAQRGRGDWIVQEYLAGRSYSIEIIGAPGRYKTYQTTEVHVDDGCDCHMITCPCPELSAAQKQSFSDTAVALAEQIGLVGIMDVEAILHNGVLKVLEIDARLPSQTPTAVFHSTGINMLAELHALFCGDWIAHSCTAAPVTERATALEHVEISQGVKEIGEGIMAQCAPVQMYEGRFGADTVITDHRPDDTQGGVIRATLIYTAQSMRSLKEKRRRAHAPSSVSTSSPSFSPSPSAASPSTVSLITTSTGSLPVC